MDTSEAAAAKHCGGNPNRSSISVGERTMAENVGNGLHLTDLNLPTGPFDLEIPPLWMEVRAGGDVDTKWRAGPETGWR